ncbi:unnamed protein product [Lactuca virosa]|uniref:Uncharacterized protein n=1 Tax=Lactuca virosa TaxID=75947 RepID=A0AAU9NX01_9ASTR|nr:unnamed protein product [Lactuca virosa]
MVVPHALTLSPAHHRSSDRLLAHLSSARRLLNSHSLPRIPAHISFSGAPDRTRATSPPAPLVSGSLFIAAIYDYRHLSD